MEGEQEVSDDLIRRSDVIKAIDDNVNGSDNRVYLKGLIKAIPTQIDDGAISKRSVNKIICKHCVKAMGHCKHHWDCPLLTEIAKYKDEPQTEDGEDYLRGYQDGFNARGVLDRAGVEIHIDKPRGYTLKADTSDAWKPKGAPQTEADRKDEMWTEAKEMLEKWAETDEFRTSSPHSFKATMKERSE